MPRSSGSFAPWDHCFRDSASSQSPVPYCRTLGLQGLLHCSVLASIHVKRHQVFIYTGKIAFKIILLGSYLSTGCLFPMAVLMYKSVPKQCEGHGMKTQRVDKKEAGTAPGWEGGALGSAGGRSLLVQDSARTILVLLESRNLSPAGPSKRSFTHLVRCVCTCASG